jgi:hypothetical protein
MRVLPAPIPYDWGFQFSGLSVENSKTLIVSATYDDETTTKTRSFNVA